MLYVLDRGHGLQAPCGESGSDCGFSAGFAGLQMDDSRRRSRGNVGIPAGISKGCGKGGKPALWLSVLSIPRHFHGLFSQIRVFIYQQLEPANCATPAKSAYRCVEPGHLQCDVRGDRPYLRGTRRSALRGLDTAGERLLVDRLRIRDSGLR
jgi:hypothetical protein